MFSYYSPYVTEIDSISSISTMLSGNPETLQPNVFMSPSGCRESVPLTMSQAIGRMSQILKLRKRYVVIRLQTFPIVL